MRPDIGKLKHEKNQAWSVYSTLSEPANKAYKDYEAADRRLAEAELYETIRRRVVRDLIDEASAEPEPESQPAQENAPAPDLELTEEKPGILG